MMNYLMLIPVLGLLSLSYAGLGLFERFARRHRVLLDIPSARSNHRRIMVRGGGVVFGTTTLFTWLAIGLEDMPAFLPGLMVAASIILTVGFIDDLRGLSVSVRLVAQVTASAIFLASIPPPALLEFELGVWTTAVWWPLALFFMVAVTNIYNFMDGIDGNAALHTAIVLATWTMMAAIGGELSVESLVCVAVLVPLVAFLLHNWTPARIFMGDSGSTFLGFTLATLAVIQVPGVGRLANFFTLVLLMMPFLFDATLTILSRVARGEPWHVPHREFLFHKLVRAGYSHAVVSLVYGSLTLWIGAVVAATRAGDLASGPIAASLIGVPLVALYVWVQRSTIPEEPARWGEIVSGAFPTPPELGSETKRSATTP